MATRDQVIKLVGTMSAGFPHVNLGKETYEVYAKLLADTPIEELEAAAMQCLASARFMPTIGELRDKVLELRRLASSDGAPDAGTAWAEVLEAASCCAYNTPTYSHPAIEQAVRAIGGIKLVGFAPSGELMSHRARFMECYGTYRERELDDQAMLPGVKAAVAKMHELAAKQRLALGVRDEA